ncbi:MAG TPA: CPCC family cysteine-rich protein [Kofleriaceae bacterium]|jgi:hypothetical protein
MAERLACACCGFLTMSEPGSYDICPVCWWEDDPTQNANAELRRGANAVCLREGRRNYLEIGASELRFLEKVRAEHPEERPVLSRNRKLVLLELPSEPALTAYLRRFGARVLRVGHPAYAPQFHAVAVSGVGLGIASEQHGLAPAAVVLGEQLLVGYDEVVCAIEIATASVTTRELPGRFHDFLLLDDGVIALHELGAVRIDASGAIRWSVDGGDVLTTFHVRAPDALELSFMEGGELHVSLGTGSSTWTRHRS